MKIVNIAGGLGNQMFQYAFAVLLSRVFPEEDVFIDTHHYRHILFKRYRGINLHNGFEINRIFPHAHLPQANSRQINKVSYWIPNYALSRLCRRILPTRKTEYISSYDDNYIYDYDALKRSGDCYYEGYWQCFRYYERIKKELLSVYSHPAPNQYNKELIEAIVKCNSVGIHVRRGDYLNEPDFYGICDLKYYSRAIREIESDSLSHTFFIFSNDMNWCQQNLIPLLLGHPVILVKENKGKDSYWDLFLMTYCKDLIIANSSFSWWGGFLNKQNGRIICPKPWVNRHCRIEIYSPEWILIE